MAHKKHRDFTRQPILSRDEALREGFTRYFTGKVCRNGHVSIRYTHSRKCVMCASEGALRLQKLAYQERPEWFRKKNRAIRNKDPIGALLTNARARAKEIGVPFSLTRNDLVFPSNCPCCNTELKMGAGPRGNGPTNQSPSLDRRIGALGYVAGNVTIICWRCNSLKKDASIEELETVLAWMKRDLGPQLSLVSSGG